MDGGVKCISSVGKWRLWGPIAEESTSLNRTYMLKIGKNSDISLWLINSFEHNILFEIHYKIIDNKFSWKHSHTRHNTLYWTTF